MSLVMAMQFGDRTCILSDSMISESGAVGHEIIPGQLKTIVLNKWVAISYSGSTNKAIAKIREIRKDLSEKKYFEEVLESLTDSTSGENRDVDFLVSSHVGIPKLYKITDGQIHYGLGMYWIGNDDAAERVLDEFKKDEPVNADLPAHMTAGEYRFREAFKKAVSAQESPHMGGLVFDCVGTPKGYLYNKYAAVHTAGDRMAVDIAFENADMWAHESPGGESYSLSLITLTGRSLAVTGAFFERSNTGFIYSPLDPYLDSRAGQMLGSPETIHPVTLKGFVNEVARYATRLETYLGR